MKRLVLFKRKKATPASFKKGNKVAVGNKNSTKEVRGRKRFMLSALMHAMEKHSGLDSAGRSRAALKICMKMIDQAIKGNTFSQNAVFDRLEGRAVQAVELSGGNKPIQMISREMPLKEAMRVLKDNMHFQFEEDDDDNSD